MQLAQLKRQAEWHITELRHAEAAFQSDELALEGAPRTVQQSKKNVAELKRMGDQHKQEVLVAEEQLRRQRRG